MRLICDDPNCPNNRRIEELERQVAELRKRLAAIPAFQTRFWDKQNGSFVDEDGCPVADQFGQLLG